MSFEYSCFISYRHGQRSLIERFISDLYDALYCEIELLLTEGIYLDRERLKGGDFFNPLIASALAKSVCMIMVFTPTYFDRNHTYCAREYKAMEKLEEKRLKLLGVQVDRYHSLIIPVILRGENYLPSFIKLHRQYYNFDRFTETERHMSRNRNYAERIKEMANYIHGRCNALRPFQETLGTERDFQLPTESEIKLWLDTLTTVTMPMPLREEGK